MNIVKTKISSYKARTVKISTLLEETPTYHFNGDSLVHITRNNIKSLEKVLIYFSHYHPEWMMFMLMKNDEGIIPLISAIEDDKVRFSEIMLKYLSFAKNLKTSHILSPYISKLMSEFMYVIL